jgi:predicted transcriptional regulator YheO
MPRVSQNSICFESAQQVYDVFGPFMNAVAAAIGPRCEVVLHDLGGESVNLEHTIAAIINGEVSGRRKGGPSSNLGFDVVADDDVDHDAFGYRGTTHDGKELRSSSVYFRNKEGRIIAALCVNYDVSALNTIKAMFEALEPDARSASPRTADELVGPNLDSVVDDMITRAITKTGRTAGTLSRDERVQIVKQLDQRGATNVTNGMMRIAQRLNVSRSTAYQYLDEARQS